MKVTSITLPVDFETSESFRKLCLRGAGARPLPSAGESNPAFVSVPVAEYREMVALKAYVHLFRDLAYSVREQKKPGFIEEADQGLFESGLGVPLESLEKCSGLLLRKPTGWFCGVFALFNASQGFQARGAHATAYGKRVKKGMETLAADVLLIPQDRLVDEHGTALTAEQTERMKLLVLCLDSALGKAPRTGGWDYSAALVANAARVLARYNDGQIDQVCRLIAQHKGHNWLQDKNTETMLCPDEGGSTPFDQLLTKLGLEEPA